MSKQPSKAYDDSDLLNGHDARPIRVLDELMQPESRLREQQVDNTIVFFGSERPKPSAVAEEDLTAFGSLPCVESERTEEEIAELQKLISIKNLSKYYDQAVELSKKLTIGLKKIRKMRSITSAPEEVSWHDGGGKPGGKRSWRKINRTGNQPAI